MDRLSVSECPLEIPNNGDSDPHKHKCVAKSVFNDVILYTCMHMTAHDVLLLRIRKV